MQDVRAIECERTRQWVSAALDCELSQFESSLVRAHLSRCAACRSFEQRLAALTAAVRSAAPETMSGRVYLPASRRLAWRTASVARLGSVAAVIVSAISIGLLAGPEQRPLGSEHVLIAAPLARPVGTNDLVIGVRRPTLASGQHQAIAFGTGGIGAYKPVLAPGP